MKTYYFYRGVVTFRNTAPGSRLRYSARIDGVGIVSASTLYGIRELIRDAQAQKSASN